MKHLATWTPRIPAPVANNQVELTNRWILREVLKPARYPFGASPLAPEGTLVQTAVAGRPLQVGILEAMPGSGRHFYSPLEYETQFVKDQLVSPGKLAVMVSKLGKPLPEGTYLVDAKGYRGILRKVLTPGRYRINRPQAA